MNSMQPVNSSEQPAGVESLTLAVEDSVYNVWQKIRPHLVLIIVSVAALLLLVSGYALVNHLQAQAENEAWRKIFVADFEARQSKSVKFADAIEKIRPEIKNTQAAAFADLMIIAQLGASEQRADWEQAAQVAKNFLAKYSGHPFALQTKFDYAAILANLGNYGEAAKIYHTLADMPDAKEFGSHARWFAALCDDHTDNFPAALDGYARVAGDRSGSYAQLAIFARTRLEERMKK